jgi:hypothetical protein
MMGDLAKALVLIGRHSNDMKDQGFLSLGAITPFKVDGPPTP